MTVSSESENAWYVVNIFKAYVCTGDSDWIEQLRNVPGMKEKYFHIRWLAIEICEKRSHTPMELFDFYFNSYEVESNQKCIFEASKKSCLLTFCDLNAAYYAVGALQKVLPKTDNSPLMWDMIRQNVPKIVGKSVLCAAEKQNRAKRQFDPKSTISMIDQLMCKRSMSSAIRGVMNEELKREISPYSLIFSEAFCCFLPN